MKIICRKISNAINSGDSRTIKLKKNIAGSFVIKLWSCGMQLLVVSLSLQFLSQYEYGVWLIIYSTLIWVDMFDMGLANGLRNRLTETIAIGDWRRAKRLVSTTVVVLSVIIVPIVLSLMIVISNIDLYSLLNVDKIIVSNLYIITYISLLFVCVTFVLKTICSIYLSLQLPAINNLITALGQTLSSISILLLICVGKGCLLNVAIVYTCSPLIAYALAWPITFKKYPMLKPSFRYFDIKELKPLFGIGTNFFLMQLSGLILFTSSNILISRMFSPMLVTPYQIANKYFGLTNILFALISTPLWSAVADAYARKDMLWITRIINKMNRILFLFLLLLLFMLSISSVAYDLWIGQKVMIPVNISILMAIYIFMVIVGTCYSNFLCGFGKIKLLTIVSVFQAVIYWPLSLLLGRLWGITGFMFALIVIFSLSAIINKVQVYLISNNKAKGLFNI